MDMDQAAVWLAGSILTSLGFIVIAGAIVIVNNVLHKYWKPVQFFRYDHLPQARFATEDELKTEPK
jgi:hypothetical protein